MRRYDLRHIMTKAWQLFRKMEISFSEALHRSWFSAKVEGVNEERIEAAKEQVTGFEAFTSILKSLFPSDSKEDYQKQQQIFDTAVSYARASEKAGFVVGFKMAMNIVHECRK